MKELITTHLEKFCETENIPTKLIEVLKTKTLKHGHYSTNLLMKINNNDKQLFFEKIKSFLLSEYPEIYDASKTQFVVPGFVNFFLSKDFLLTEALNYKDEEYKPKFNIRKQKINYEFVSANPTGYLHVGHARNSIVGDINCNVFEFLGHELTREYYINDAGNQINDLYTSVSWYYQNPNQDAPETIPYKGKEIVKCAQDFKQQFPNEDFNEFNENAKEWFVKYFFEEIKNIINELNVKPFHKYSSEKKLYDAGIVEKMIVELETKNQTKTEDGAVWLLTTKFGDDKDRVLKKSDGTYTYVAGDIAYHAQKFNGGYDKLYNLWGADHKGYEKRIFAGLEALGYDHNKLRVDFINMVQIVDGDQLLKMSKRAGTSLSIKEMLTKLDVDKLRYFIISKAKEQGHEIDIKESSEESINNPFFSMHYSFARLTSILEKGTKYINNTITDHSLLFEEEKEQELIVKMCELVDAVLYTNKTQEPMILLTYLKDLSNIFHSYYNNIVVINEDSNKLDLTIQRLELMRALKNLMKIVYKLLGIKTKEKM